MVGCMSFLVGDLIGPNKVSLWRNSIVGLNSFFIVLYSPYILMLFFSILSLSLSPSLSPLSLSLSLPLSLPLPPLFFSLSLSLSPFLSPFFLSPSLSLSLPLSLHRMSMVGISYLMRQEALQRMYQFLTV